jgi:hypothetical protein
LEPFHVFYEGTEVPPRRRRVQKDEAEVGSLDVRTLRASLGGLSEEALVALGIAKEAIGSLGSVVGWGGRDARSAA